MGTALWFAEHKDEKFTLCHRPTAMKANHPKEAAVMDDGAVLLELTPFGKFDVMGKMLLLLLTIWPPPILTVL